MSGAIRPAARTPQQAAAYLATTPTMGFKSLGEHARACYLARRDDVQIMDPRLKAAAAAQVSQETVGSDGGNAVPSAFLPVITSAVTGEKSLLSMTNPLKIDSNVFNAPVDEASKWGANGIKAYWRPEAAAITQSKIALVSDCPVQALGMTTGGGRFHSYAEKYVFLTAAGELRHLSLREVMSRMGLVLLFDADPSWLCKNFPAPTKSLGFNRFNLRAASNFLIRQCAELGWLDTVKVAAVFRADGVLLLRPRAAASKGLTA